jgi:uncharacterized protein
MKGALMSAHSENSVLSRELSLKYEALQAYMRNLESVVVAFSGGVDSSLVARVAGHVLKDNALAVTSASDSLKRDDLELTVQLTTVWQIPHKIIHTEELENSHYTANPVNRCYYCKSTLYQDLEKIASAGKYHHVVNGTNLDDLGDHRPGLLAAREYGVRTPLADCRFSKAEIRKLASHLGMENAKKPQAACLSSRVPYGTAVSRELLNQIERAETILLRLGFTQCRVRHHDTIARIEILPDEFEIALRHHQQIQERFKACGYQYVTLDLGGFRSGSLNEPLH